MRANGKCSAVKLGGAVCIKAGAQRSRSAANPSAGFGPKFRIGGTSRVKGSIGSFNARWRREPGGGNTDPPEANHFRRAI